MIECIDLIKIYESSLGTKIPALRGCELMVEDGELVSIVGPSGSGKTTLINILGGIETISSGEAIVAGYRLEKITPENLNNYRLKIIGFVDQFPERTLFLDATVNDNLQFAYTLRYGDTPTTGVKRKKIMGDLGISHLENRLVKTLSGGEMTRVAIACALAKKTPLLLCDEPTGQLDSENTKNVKQLLKQIAEKYDTTVVVVTHDSRFLEGVDKTYEIRDGRISTVLSEEERKQRSSFPIYLKSYIDQTKHTRLPDIVYDTLQLERNLEFKVTKKGLISIGHPEKKKPKEVKLPEYKEQRKQLLLEPLPKDYCKNSKKTIKLENVTKTYPYKKGEVHALTGIDLEIREGELLFILGPSGSGKTTLLKVITGLVPCTEGTITILGENFSEKTDEERAAVRREEFGIVSQQGNMHPYLTVRENLYLKEIYSSKKKGKKDSTKSEKKTLLETYQIIHKQNNYPPEISGGELQRAMLAMANNGTPKILVLDEPTANLDSELVEQTVEQLYKMNKETAQTTIIATHNITMIREKTRAIELVDGRIVKDGLVVTKKREEKIRIRKRKKE